MCHAKFPDEGRTICSQVRDVAELDSLQQHAENCNDQCPERTEGPGSRPGVGHPVMVKSSYTPDLGEHDNQVGLARSKSHLCFPNVAIAWENVDNYFMHTAMPN